MNKTEFHHSKILDFKYNYVHLAVNVVIGMYVKNIVKWLKLKIIFNLQNDDTGDFVIENGTVNLSDIKIGNAPQTSFGVGFVADVAEGLSVDQIIDKLL